MLEKTQVRYPCMQTSYIENMKQQLDEAVGALKHRLSSVRTGRASPGLLEHLVVEAYGGRVPLSQVATVNAPEARLFTVHVWDSAVVSAVTKAIQASVSMPVVEGNVLRVPLAELSQKQRQDLVDVAKSHCEAAKVGGRNIRRGIMDALNKDPLSEDDKARVKKEVEKLSTQFASSVDKILQDKEKEILTV